MALKVKLRARDSPPRAAFSFGTLSPPDDDQGPATAVAFPRPPGDFLPERDMHMYGAQPLVGIDEPGRGVVRCARCGRAVLEWAAGEHRRKSCREWRASCDGVKLFVRGSSRPTPPPLNTELTIKQVSAHMYLTARRSLSRRVQRPRRRSRTARSGGPARVGCGALR